ncbi:hypothetical protein XELAEV_18000530mg, partial [Xenopus laevis]
MLSALEAKEGSTIYDAAVLLGQMGEMNVDRSERKQQRSLAKGGQEGHTCVKITRRQMFLDLLNSGVPIETIDGKQTKFLLAMWRELTAKGKLRPAKPKK